MYDDFCPLQFMNTERDHTQTRIAIRWRKARNRAYAPFNNSNEHGMVLGVALLAMLVMVTPAISAPDGLPNQGSINSFSPFSSAVTSQPLVNSTFIPFPSVQFTTPLIPATQVILIPQPFPTSIGTLQPSIGVPSSFLGSFTPSIGTPVTTLGTFQPSIGVPITSLGSFAPSIGVPLVTLGSFQPSIGSPITVLGSFLPGIGAPQPTVTSTNTVVPAVLITPTITSAVTTTGTMNNLPVNITSPVFVPATVTGISLALTNGHLAAIDPTDPPSSASSHILNPEPSSLVLSGTALGGLALVKWWSLRKRRRAR